MLGHHKYTDNNNNSIINSLYNISQIFLRKEINELFDIILSTFDLRFIDMIVLTQYLSMKMLILARLSGKTKTYNAWFMNEGKIGHYFFWNCKLMSGLDLSDLSNERCLHYWIPGSFLFLGQLSSSTHLDEVIQTKYKDNRNQLGCQNTYLLILLLCWMIEVKYWAKSQFSTLT